MSALEQIRERLLEIRSLLFIEELQGSGLFQMVDEMLDAVEDIENEQHS